MSTSGKSLLKDFVRFDIEYIILGRTFEEAGLLGKERFNLLKWPSKF
jgi:hypothetical protein